MMYGVKAFVEFNLTTGCPNVCKYCPQSVFTKAYAQCNPTSHALKMDDYITMIDKLPKSCISIAGFSEPFTNKQCTEMIDYAGKKGHMVIIYTTLQGMTIDDYEKLRKMYHVKGLTVHLPDKEGNTKTYISEGYKKLLKHIVTHPMGAWCNFDFSVHGTAVHPDLIHIVSVNPIYRIHDRAGCLKTNDPTVHRVHWESGAIRCGNGFGQYPEGGIVMPNGDVYLCCMDWKLEYKLGNLLEQSWADVMASDERKRMKEDRETGRHGEICRHCAEACMDYRR